MGIACGIGAVSLVVAIGFGLAGAWLILPFAAVEFIAVVWLLRVLLRRLNSTQLLVFGPHTIVLVRKHSRIAIDRGQARILIEPALRYTDWPRIAVTGGGRTIELGEFLNEEESQSLQNILRDIVGLRVVQPSDYQVHDF